MTLESESDRLALLVGDDRETFLIDGVQVIGVFHAPYSEPMEIESSQPQLYVRTSDVNGAVHGSTVIRESDSAEYQIVNIQPDSQGMTQLMLEEQ